VPSVHHEHESAYPPEVFFRAIWDLEFQRSVNTNLLVYEVEGGGEPRAGARIRLVAAGLGREITHEIKGFESSGPEFASEVEVKSPGVVHVTKTRLSPLPEGKTRVVQEVIAKPTGIFGWLMLPFHWLALRGTLRAQRAHFVKMEAALAQYRAKPLVKGPARSSKKRCPYCHEEPALQDSVACAECGAQHHAECWDAHGECSSCSATVRFTAPEVSPGRPRREQRKECS